MITPRPLSHCVRSLFQLCPCNLPTRSRRSTKRHQAIAGSSQPLEVRAVLSVATSHTLGFVTSADLPLSTSHPDATSLANGGFVLAGIRSANTELDFFNANSSPTATASAAGVNPAIDRLRNGNLVLATQDSDSILFQIFDSNGATVVVTTDLGDTNSRAPDVAALASGGFVTVNEDQFTGLDFDIDVNIFSSTGTFVASLTVDTSLAEDRFPKVAALANGNFAVTWTRFDSGNSDVMYAVYGPTGSVVKAPTVLDGVGSVNKDSNITSTLDGFAIVFVEDGWGTGGNDITLSELDGVGTVLSNNNVSNPTLSTSFADAFPYVTRLSNNLLAVGYEQVTEPTNRDTHVRLFDPLTNQISTATTCRLARVAVTQWVRSRLQDR